jgi:hypothetical protein
MLSAPHLLLPACGEKAGMRGPLRDSERRNSEPSGTAPSPLPLPARGEREARAASLA